MTDFASSAELQMGVDGPAAPERAVRAFRELIGMICEDPATSARMTLADTSVQINLSDASGYAFTVHLDGERVELGDCEPQAQIALAMTTLQLEQLTRGELALAMEIAHGNVAYSGPVRKFLRVIPILRRVSRDWLAGAAFGAAPATAASLDVVEGADLV
jgi:hypothetical protein